MQRNSHRVPQRHGAHCDTYTCSLRIVMHVQHVAFLSNQSYASKSGIEARHRSREIVPGTHPNELAEGSKPRGMAIGLSLICVEYEYAMHKAVYFFVTSSNALALHFTRQALITVSAGFGPRFFPGPPAGFKIPSSKISSKPLQIRSMSGRIFLGQVGYSNEPRSGNPGSPDSALQYVIRRRSNSETKRLQQPNPNRVTRGIKTGQGARQNPVVVVRSLGVISADWP
eukprot:1179029-Prorocentrum_minimum.AAC.8